MIITLENLQQRVIWDQKLERKLLEGLNSVAIRRGLSEQVEVGITIVDDEEIRAINREYRGVDRVTDVISFALNDNMEEDAAPKLMNASEENLLGDIVISAEAALRQGKEFGHGLEREIVYLAVHGLLHLLGYDHMSESDRAVMRFEEESALRMIDLAEEKFR